MATTRKTSTKITPGEEAYDFDSWDEAAEQAAIKEAATATQVRYIISEHRFFVAKFPDGEIFKVPLQISFADIEAIKDSGGDESDQVKKLLELLGDEDGAERLSHKDILSVMDFAGKFFHVFERITQVTSGE